MLDAIALYVESLTTQPPVENQAVPGAVAAAGQQMPYQQTNQQPAASVPAAVPMAAVPAAQPQMNQQTGKATTPENGGVKVEGE